MRAEWRASDADRDATAERLRAAHAEGRLDTAELEERLERCYAAKTYGDLEALAADLPRPRPRSGGGRERVSVGPSRLVPILLLVALAVAWHAAWLAWLILVLAIVRVRRRARRYGGGSCAAVLPRRRDFV
jgi:hypothetical protein